VLSIYIKNLKIHFNVKVNMKFAIIGCGSIGRSHIGNLLHLGQEVVAWNRNKSRRDLVEKKFKIKTYKDLDEMLEIKNLSGVFICSPNSFHLSHANKVINKNINVFIEKPLAIELKGLSVIENQVKKKGLISHVGSNMRFNFGPSTVKKYIEKGTIGRILWANFWGGMYLPFWHPDEDYRKMYSAKINLGGGAVLDFIHEIDLIHWMFGKPTKLAAILGQTQSLEIETEDIADVIMKFSNGLKLNLHIDYLQRPYQRGIHILGDKGSIKWDLFSKNIIIHNYNTKKEIIKNYPKDYDHNDMYLSQMKYFLNCIRKKQKSEADITAGKKSLELALAIKKSSIKNKFIKG